MRRRPREDLSGAGLPGVGPVALVVALATVLAACGSAPRLAGPGGSSQQGHVLTVLAAENTWGSIVSQLGGSHVRVTSIVTNPNADPHEYESSSADARLAASADYAVLNGAGYDDWAQRLLAANPSASRRVLVVSRLVGRGPGDDPHLWYSPSYVARVMQQVTSDLESMDPPDRADFAAAHERVLEAFAPYRGLVAAIHDTYKGERIGATEDIFTYMAGALGLDLVSPPSFMRAVAEGNDPPVESVRTFQAQVSSKEIRVLVYNTQTVTPLTTNIRRQADAARIPVIGVSETLQPPGSRFEDWQVSQLRSLQAALAQG